MVSTADDEPGGTVSGDDRSGDARDGGPVGVGADEGTAGDEPGGAVPGEDRSGGARDGGPVRRVRGGGARRSAGAVEGTADAEPTGAVAGDDRAGAGADEATATEGAELIRWNLGATVVFAVTSALAAAAPDTFSVMSVPVALALFAVGSVLFGWGFLVGLGRSRYEAVTLGGLFFLAEGVAPVPVRRALRALLAVQVVVAVAAAVVRPFTELAFGVLVPTLGLGAITLWAARYATFPPRPPEPGR